MFRKPHCPMIAIEEHYWDAELAKHFVVVEAGRGGETAARLHDLGDLRLKEMDEAAIRCIHVVPHLLYVPMMMSPSRGSNLSQR